MEYVLREQRNNQYYCKDHSKIITFNSQEKANQFLNAFAQYAMAEGMQFMMSDPGMLMEVQSTLQSTIIEEKPKDETLKFISYDDILKEKGAY